VKKALMALGGVIAALAGFALVRTVRYTSARSAVERPPAVPVPDGAAERLAESVRIATISHENRDALDADALATGAIRMPNRSLWARSTTSGGRAGGRPAASEGK
jgi:hypothetical protein